MGRLSFGANGTGAGTFVGTKACVEVGAEPSVFSDAQHSEAGKRAMTTADARRRIQRFLTVLLST
jgi:hypothetical protein